MKNKQSKSLSLSLSVNSKHSISERFKAFTHGFCHFLKKFKDKWNTSLIVILGHTLNVILGLIPRIHAKHLSNVIIGLVPIIWILGSSPRMTIGGGCILRPSMTINGVLSRG